MRKVWVLVAGFVAVGTFATPAGAKPSGACATALKKADRVVKLLADYVVADIESTGTDDAAVRARGSKLRLSSDGVAVTKAYLAAAKKCRA